MESMVRQWLVVESNVARWFYSLRDYPSSLEGDEEGGWGGIPPLKGARGDGTVLVVI